MILDADLDAADPARDQIVDPGHESSHEKTGNNVNWVCTLFNQDARNNLK